MNVPWQPHELFTGMMTSILSPLLCLAFLVASLNLVMGKRKEGLAALGSMMALFLGWNIIKGENDFFQNYTAS